MEWFTKVVAVFAILIGWIWIDIRLQEYKEAYIFEQNQEMFFYLDEGNLEGAIKVLLSIEVKDVKNPLILVNISTLTYSFKDPLIEDYGFTEEEVYQKVVIAQRKAYSIDPSTENLRVLAYDYMIPYLHFKEATFEWEKAEETWSLLYDKFSKTEGLHKGAINQPLLWQSKCNQYGGEFEKAMALMVLLENRSESKDFFNLRYGEYVAELEKQLENKKN